MNKIRGKLLMVSPILTFTTSNGKEFHRRNFVLDCTRHDPYTGERGRENTPEFELIQDKCSLVDNMAIGSIVDVEFYLDGRAYTSKTTGKNGYITTVRASSVVVADYQPVQQSAQPTTPQQAQPMPQVAQPQPKVQTADDLPF